MTIHIAPLKSFNAWKFLFVAQTFLLVAFILYACGEKTSSQTNTPKNMKIDSFDGINLIVKDIAAQKKFYRDVLGLELESDYGDAVFFKIGDRKLGLFAKGHHKEGDASLEGAPKGVSHLEFGISTDANEHLTKKLTDAGFHAYRDVFKDADGNLFHFNLDKEVKY